MNLRQLKYFVTIVDAGSFSRAAQIAHVAQPALSQQIAELEGLLGVALLLRSARGVRPTVAGERLYAEARSILRRVERLPDTVRGSDGDIEGNVRVGMSSTLAAALGGQMIAACRTVLPRVRLQFSSAGSAQLAERLRDQMLDLTVLFEEPSLTGFVYMPLFRRRLFLVGRAGEATSSEPIDFSALAGVPLVLPSPPNVTRAVLDRLFAKAGFKPVVAAETDLVTDMLAAVESRVGDAILPLIRADALSGSGGFVTREISPVIELAASIASSSEHPLSAAGEALRDFISSFVLRYLSDEQVSDA